MSEAQADGQPAPEPAQPPRSFVLRVLWHPLTRLFFKLALAAGLLTWMALSGSLNPKELLQGEKDYGWLGVSVVLMLPCLFISALRFKFLLDGLGMPCAYGRALNWTMIGVFFNVAMPSATGGDVVKALYVVNAYPREKRAPAVLSVLLDRMMGLFGLFFLAFMVSLAGGAALEHRADLDPDAQDKLLFVVRLVRWMCLGFVLCFWCLTSRRLERSAWRKRVTLALPFGAQIEKLYMGFAGLRERPVLLLGLLGLSNLNHIFLTASFLALAQGLHTHFDLLAGLVVIPLLFFARTFGFAGGFGVGEFASKIVAPVWGIAASASSNLMFAFNLLNVFISLLGLPFYLLTGRALPRGEIALDGATAQDLTAETRRHGEQPEPGKPRP